MISVEDLKSDDEKISDAVRRAAGFRRASRICIYFRIVGVLLAGYFVYGYLGNTETWVWDYAVPLLAPVFLCGLIAGHIAESIVYRVEDLGTPPGFFEQYFNYFPARPPPATESYPVTTSVPRHAQLRGASDVEIMTAKLKDGPSTLAAAGGRATTEPDQLPIGVLMLTEEGLVFLPDAEPELALALKELGPVAWELGKEAEERLGLLKELGLGDIIKKIAGGLDLLDALGIGDSAEPGPKLPDWISKSLAHPEHFAIAWPDMVAVHLDQSALLTTVTREKNDGSRAQFVFAAGAGPWPSALMQLRIEHELLALGRLTVMRPKAEELLPGIMAQFRAIYGDRVDAHGDEILRELNQRVTSWLDEAKPDLGPLMREAMAPILPHYAQIPSVVANQPWLFEGLQKAEAPM